jgi:flavin-dependent dehydrogenase
MAFQVRRALFDELLLRNAERAGAEVRERWTVEQVRFEGERAVGVRARDPEGGEHHLGAPLVVDASGRDCVVGRQLGIRRPDPALRQAAMFAHWEGARMGLGRDGGDILVVGGPAGWYWLIPLDERTTSVGVVYPGKVARGRRGSNEDLYHELLARSPEVSARLAGARRVVPVNAAADFSYRLERFAGDGWVAVGDAAGFLDPVFSSGVYVGTSMAERAADLVAPLLRRGVAPRAADFRGYSRFVARSLDRFKRYILAYYDPAFIETFSTEPPLEMFRAAVVSILGGGIHDRDPRIWIGDKAFFLAIERERRLARAGKKMLPPAPAYDGNLAGDPTSAGS